MTNIANTNEKKDSFVLDKRSMNLVERLHCIQQHFARRKDGWYFIRHACRAVNARLDMKINGFAECTIHNAATLWYDRLTDLSAKHITATVRWDGYVLEN